MKKSGKVAIDNGSTVSLMHAPKNVLKLIIEPDKTFVSGVPKYNISVNFT